MDDPVGIFCVLRRYVEGEGEIVASLPLSRPRPSYLLLLPVFPSFFLPLCFFFWPLVFFFCGCCSLSAASPSAYVPPLRYHAISSPTFPSIFSPMYLT